MQLHAGEFAGARVREVEGIRGDEVQGLVIALEADRRVEPTECDCPSVRPLRRPAHEQVVDLRGCLPALECGRQLCEQIGLSHRLEQTDADLPGREAGAAADPVVVGTAHREPRHRDGLRLLERDRRALGRGTCRTAAEQYATERIAHASSDAVGEKRDSAYAHGSGGGDSGAKDGEGGRGKGEGSVNAIAGALSTAKSSGTGTAGDTVARSEAPVMSAQKQGASLGAEGGPWCPAWPAAAWWCRQASRARTVRPPGPAASQHPAASSNAMRVVACRIAPILKARVSGTQPRRSWRSRREGGVGLYQPRAGRIGPPAECTRRTVRVRDRD